jgi:ABC-type transporter Mla MlaB component
MSGVVFPLPRSLTHDDAHQVSAAIAQALAQAQLVAGAGAEGDAPLGHSGEAANSSGQGRASTERCLRLDAHALEHIDSAALAVVLQAQRDAHALGWTVTVAPIPPRLLQLAQMYGVAELLGWAG